MTSVHVSVALCRISPSFVVVCVRVFKSSFLTLKPIITDYYPSKQQLFTAVESARRLPVENQIEGFSPPPTLLLPSGAFEKAIWPYSFPFSFLFWKGFESTEEKWHI